MAPKTTLKPSDSPDMAKLYHRFDETNTLNSKVDAVNQAVNKDPTQFEVENLESTYSGITPKQAFGDYITIAGRTIRKNDIEALADFLKEKDQDTYARSAAATALGEVAKAGGTIPEQAIEALAGFLKEKDQDADARSAAARTLGEVAKTGGQGATDALKALGACIQDFSAPQDVRSHSADILGSIAEAGSGVLILIHYILRLEQPLRFQTETITSLSYAVRELSRMAKVSNVPVDQLIKTGNTYYECGALDVAWLYYKQALFAGNTTEFNSWDLCSRVFETVKELFIRSGLHREEFDAFIDGIDGWVAFQEKATNENYKSDWLKHICLGLPLTNQDSEDAAEHFYQLGLLYQGKQNRSGMIDCLEEALALCSTHTEARILLANTLITHPTRYCEALYHYRRLQTEKSFEGKDCSKFLNSVNRKYSEFLTRSQAYAELNLSVLTKQAPWFLIDQIKKDFETARCKASAQEQKTVTLMSVKDFTDNPSEEDPVLLYYDNSNLEHLSALDQCCGMYCIPIEQESHEYKTGMLQLLADLGSTEQKNLDALFSEEVVKLQADLDTTQPSKTKQVKQSTYSETRPEEVQ